MNKKTDSAWAATCERKPGTASRDEVVDVCVVGAGIAGLTTAYLLVKAGKRVAVLEARDTIGAGETAYTTAHLTWVIDDRFREVARCRGDTILRLAIESHASAIDRIELIAREERIECDFRRVDGYLFLAPGDVGQLLEEELTAARNAGLTSWRLPTAPLPVTTRSCLCFPQQGQFHPLKYLIGLHRAIERMGGLVFTDCAVQQIQPGSPCRVLTRTGHTVTADAVVVATNTPMNDMVTLHTKQAPYTSYAFAAQIPAGQVYPGLYWDTEDPYHYVRMQPFTAEQELLIIGGADHKTGQDKNPEGNWEKLERWGRAHFPQMAAVLWRWSGQVMETLDGLAFIGPDPGGQRNVYIATGDSGMGMTHGTIAGILLSDMLTGHQNPWAEVYDPGRVPFATLGKLFQENANVAVQYLDWMTGGEVSNVEEIPPGQGALIRQGLTKLAVYRDESGQTHTCSAVCPHLGCIVAFNDAEKTWDCPCHGSRFSARGQVLHGPALNDLATVNR